MNLSQLIEILDIFNSRKKFLEVIENEYSNDKSIIPDHENQMMSGFVDLYKSSLDKFENSHTDPVEYLINTALENGYASINTYDNKLVICISVDCEESTNLTTLSREEIKRVFDNSVFRVHNIIRENMSDMLDRGGKIILLNRYRGSYDTVAYTLEALAGTFYREIRDTDIHISLIDYFDVDKNLLGSRVFDCINSKQPKFHYCVGTNVYLSKLATKILPEDIVSDVHQA